MSQFRRPLPGSFRVIAIMAVVWMAFGCLSYLMHVTMSPEAIASLPQGQQDYMKLTPSWLYALFAIATWGGLAGALLLLFRKQLSVWLLLISWLAAAAHMGLGYFMLPGFELLGGVRGLIMPVIIVALGIAFWRYAKGAAREGWLV